MPPKIGIHPTDAFIHAGIHPRASHGQSGWVDIEQ
jgi:hypothetical protein